MDPIEQLKKLAGIMPANSIAEDFEHAGDNNQAGSMSPLGSNISITGMEKRRLEKEHNIKPGTDAWFKLWFSRPYLTGEKPVDDKPRKH